MCYRWDIGQNRPDNPDQGSTEMIDLIRKFDAALTEREAFRAAAGLPLTVELPKPRPIEADIAFATPADSGVTCRNSLATALKNTRAF